MQIQETLKGLYHIFIFVLFQVGLTYVTPTRTYIGLKRKTIHINENYALSNIFLA